MNFGRSNPKQTQTPQEMTRAVASNARSDSRSIQRDRQKIERDLKKLDDEIRVLAKNPTANRMLLAKKATQHNQLKASLERLASIQATLASIPTTATVVNAQRAEMNAMQTATNAMRAANASMNSAEMQRVAAEYQREVERSEMQFDMTSEFMDGDVDDEEVDEEMLKVLREAGVEKIGNLPLPAASTPQQAYANPAASYMLPEFSNYSY